ncbi:MAG: hypothetical protein R6W77_02890, partial [Trueperaceae bacterium]
MHDVPARFPHALGGRGLGAPQRTRPGSRRNSLDSSDERYPGGHAAARRSLEAATGGLLTAIVLVAGAVLFGTTAQAQGAPADTPPSLVLPADADLAVHAALVPAAVPVPPEGGFDLVAVENAALAQADLLPAELWEVDALAESLGPDLDSAFAFVREHIAFDPYAGVLRGADGALAARAGNAWDRALLLRALLEYHGHRTRLAMGELDDGAVDTLLATSALGAPRPLDDPHPASVSTFDVDALATRAWRDHALLTQALAGAGALESVGEAGGAGVAAAESAAGGVAGAVVPDIRAAIRSHVWVQVEQLDGT